MNNIATIEILEDIRVRQGNIVETWEAGALVVLPMAQAQAIVARAGPKMRLVRNKAVHPLIGSTVLLEDQLKPWIVTGVTTADESADRWLLLFHVSEARLKREIDVQPYRCPMCAGFSIWYVAGVWCAACAPPDCPDGRPSGKSFSTLTQNLISNPNQTLLQAELDAETTPTFSEP